MRNRFCQKDPKHGFLRKDGDRAVCPQLCGYEEPWDGVKRGRDFRYPLSLKLDYVRAVLEGADKNAIIKKAGCSITALNNWIEKYGETVKKHLDPTPDPPTQPKLADRVRRSNGSLDLTEEQRLFLLLVRQIQGVNVVVEETGIDRSTLNRWARWHKLTGFTLTSLSIEAMPGGRDRIYVLRKLRYTLISKQHEIEKQIDAVNKAIEVLETPAVIL